MVNVRDQYDQFEHNQQEALRGIYTPRLRTQIDFRVAETIGLLQAGTRDAIQAELGADLGHAIFRRRREEELEALEEDPELDRAQRNFRAFANAFDAVYGRFIYEYGGDTALNADFATAVNANTSTRIETTNPAYPRLLTRNSLKVARAALTEYVGRYRTTPTPVNVPTLLAEALPAPPTSENPFQQGEWPIVGNGMTQVIDIARQIGRDNRRRVGTVRRIDLNRPDPITSIESAIKSRETQLLEKVAVAGGAGATAPMLTGAARRNCERELAKLREQLKLVKSLDANIKRTFGKFKTLLKAYIDNPAVDKASPYFTEATRVYQQLDAIDFNSNNYTPQALIDLWTVAPPVPPPPATPPTPPIPSFEGLTTTPYSNLSDDEIAKRIIKQILRREYSNAQDPELDNMVNLALLEGLGKVITSDTYAETAEKASPEKLEAMNGKMRRQFSDMVRTYPDAEGKPLFEDLTEETLADDLALQNYVESPDFTMEKGFQLMKLMEVFEGDARRGILRRKYGFTGGKPSKQRAIVAERTKDLLALELAGGDDLEEKMRDQKFLNTLDEGFKDLSKKYGELANNFITNYRTNRKDIEKAEKQDFENRLKQLYLRYQLGPNYKPAEGTEQPAEAEGGEEGGLSYAQYVVERNKIRDEMRKKGYLPNGKLARFFSFGESSVLLRSRAMFNSAMKPVRFVGRWGKGLFKAGFRFIFDGLRQPITKAPLWEETKTKMRASIDVAIKNEKYTEGKKEALATLKQELDGLRADKAKKLLASKKYTEIKADIDRILDKCKKNLTTNNATK